jgi:ribosome biogenesis protein BMS1
VVLEPEEKKLYTLMQRVNTLKAEKQKLERVRKEKEKAKFAKKRAAEAAPFADKKREEKKRKYRLEGLKTEDRMKKRQKGGFVASS